MIHKKKIASFVQQHAPLFVFISFTLFLLGVIVVGYHSASAATTVTKERCGVVWEWFEAGTLTKDHPDALEDADLCYRQHPDVWQAKAKAKIESETKGPAESPAKKSVTQTRCENIKKWFDAGTLTDDHESALDDANLCAEQYPDLWSGEEEDDSEDSMNETTEDIEVTEDICRQVKGWFDEGSLTDEHEEFEDAADVCVHEFPDIMAGEQDIPSATYEDDVIENYTGYENPFPDTDLSDLAGMSAAELSRRDVVDGYPPDGEFRGDREVNRAEAARFVLLTANVAIEDLPNNGRFSDVAEGQWYVPYIMTAVQLEVINGYPDGTFKPGNKVNTAEFLVMLAKLFDLETDLPHSYTDISADQWFAKYAGIAERYELFPYRETTLEPGRKLTRSEVAIALYQYLKNRD